MPHPHPSTPLAALIAVVTLVAGGCVAPPAPDFGGYRGSAHLSAGGGADLGPLTDAQGRRRSLALAPAGVVSEGGFYAARNDGQRTVTAGFRSPTFQTAQTRTVDRGVGSGGSFGRGVGRGFGFGLRDGITTRTIRRSSTQTVR